MVIGRDIITVLAEGHVPALTGTKVDLAPGFVVEADELEGAIFIAPSAGVARAITFTIAAGPFLAGEEFRCTIVDNSESRQIWRKSYSTIVVAGDTATTIATRLANQMAADGLTAECPYTAANVAGVITVTSKQLDKKTLVGYAYTDSAAGTNVYAVSVAGTRKEGQPSDLMANGIPAENINLASYYTVRIVYVPFQAAPHVESKNHGHKELIWYGTPGNGNALAVLINSL